MICYLAKLTKHSSAVIMILIFCYFNFWRDFGIWPNFTQHSSDCSAVIMIISSPEMWITMFPAAKNVQLKMGCRRQPTPPPPPAAQLKSFFKISYGQKKKRKVFGRSNHYRKVYCKNFHSFILRISPRNFKMCSKAKNICIPNFFILLPKVCPF